MIVVPLASVDVPLTDVTPAAMGVVTVGISERVVVWSEVNPVNVAGQKLLITCPKQVM